MGYTAMMERLGQGKAVVMDGGMGTEISRRGIAAGSSELSVNAMLESPDKIREIHEDYIRAGAEVIITNTYICNTVKLAHIGWIDESNAHAQMVRLNKTATKVAVEARDAHPGRDVVIAGSLGPLRQSYNPDSVLPYDQCLDAYRLQARALADAGADVILVETCTRVHEAVAGGHGRGGAWTTGLGRFRGQRPGTGVLR